LELDHYLHDAGSVLVCGFIPCTSSLSYSTPSQDLSSWKMGAEGEEKSEKKKRRKRNRN